MAWEFVGFRPKKIDGVWRVVDAKRPTRVIEEPDLRGPYATDSDAWRTIFEHGPACRRRISRMTNPDRSR